jgi:hypothetical protein
MNALGNKQIWSLWELVHDFSPGRLIGALARVHAFIKLPDGQCHMTRADYDTAVAKCQIVRDEAEKFELDAGLAGAERLLAAVKGAVPRNNNMVMISAVQLQLIKTASLTTWSGVRDGLMKRLAISIEPHKVKLYEQAEPLYGNDVDVAFPGFVAENISEAGKCLALDRGTACVFHLMRALDKVVQLLGEKLNVTIIDKNNVDLDWGIILANMVAPISAMPKGPAKNEWSEAHTLLVHVKQAWRHPTMHPKDTYTPEEATKIFDAVGSFMQHMAKLVA